MERKYLITEINPRTGKLETFDYRTGELVATEEGTRNKFVYSFEIGQAICNLVRQGKTLKKIADMSGMPPLYIMYNWKNIHPDFKENLKQAKKDRADYYHDMAEAVLEDAEGASKDDVPAQKLRFDGYLKLAERGNPEEFNPKPQLLQNAHAPTMIVINTGINRGDPITIEANNEEICIGERSEDGLRRVHEESGRVETYGAEVSGLDGEGRAGASGGELSEIGGGEAEAREEEAVQEEIGGEDANR